MTDMINNRFGELLAAKRKETKRNIPLTQVERETGVPRRTLMAWANNTVQRFDIKVMNALCAYFDVGPGQLFEYIPEEVQND